MDYEQALVAQAGPFMMAAKARALMVREVDKGCMPVILPQPLALEPPFCPIATSEMADELSPDLIYEPIPTSEELTRYQVWISPEEPFSWNCAELFLKQLLQVSHRVGLEIIGNREKITITILCRQSDSPIILTAFQGKFRQCKLSPLKNNLLSQPDSNSWQTIQFRDYFPSPPYYHLLTRSDELHVSSYECLFTALANIKPPAMGIYQSLFQPVSPLNNWYRNIKILMDLEYVANLVNNVGIRPSPQQVPSASLYEISDQVKTKAHNDKPIYAVAMRIAIIGVREDDQIDYLSALSTFCSLFQHGGRPLNYLTEQDYLQHLSPDQLCQMFMLGLTYRSGFLVNSAELIGMAHIPPASIIDHLDISLDTMDTLAVAQGALTTGKPIGTCNIAGREQVVCIPQELQSRHFHLIGGSGTGKSTLEEQMICHDIRHGHGVAVLDPHGDLVEKLLCLIPAEAVDRTIYFDPGDPDWIPIWNPMQRVPGQDIGRMTDDLVGAFKSFITGWGDRMETILRQSIFGLLHLSHSTFLDVADILRPDSKESEILRKSILEVVQAVEARQFWQHDFLSYRSDEFGPPKHKLNKLLLSGTVSLMVSQPNSKINFRNIMDDGMIFLANFSHLGTEVREILGSFMLAIIHLTALSRSNIPKQDRKLFQVYLDEAHRFRTESLEDIISETRKYEVGLTLAHQYMKQFDEKKKGALNSVGTTIIFNVDSTDANHLSKRFHSQVKVEDITSLVVGEAIVRCGTDIARIKTLPPLKIPETHFRDRIIAQSRMRYCKPAAEVRQMINHRSDRHQQPYSPLVPVIGTGRENQPPKEFTYDVC